ncbi:LysR family transcriptional regulator [Glaciimonas immobilis]|uniref:DNA-binding transcriptional LysR family regulator n=1 Tax=Glaciimonas immobilis TaxID=728004 RepID=A0A840RT71_9BURK|nr:LysR family transcriptional regulator [Glaciimonas immobilis]KAF3996925.1 LysR family transcriptional regulator [Glaciimonas immobilis]MBB5199750.1 DNA-binding transcriptional LysR family regulator [Glaciimonas immobilis]
MTPAERLKGLETFVAVAEAGSFTAAAERLNLTKSAVGKAVARLEGRLKKPLFERTTRRLQMTDAGDAFYKVCVRVLEELELAERVLAADEIIPSGRLRVDLPATFGRIQAFASLLEFAEKYQQVMPQVSFTDRFVDVVEDGMDVVLRIGGDDTWSAAVGYKYLGHEELVFCASPGYLLAHGEPQSVEELLHHDTVLYGRADGSNAPWLIKDGQQPLARQHVNPRIVLGQAEAQVAAVEAGLGIAQLATWLVEQQIRDGRLQKILPQLATQGLPLHIVWQRSRQHAPKVQALISHFETTLAIRPHADNV